MAISEVNVLRISDWQEVQLEDSVSAAIPTSLTLAARTVWSVRSPTLSVNKYTAAPSQIQIGDVVRFDGINHRRA